MSEFRDPLIPEDGALRATRASLLAPFLVMAACTAACGFFLRKHGQVQWPVAVGLCLFGLIFLLTGKRLFFPPVFARLDAEGIHFVGLHLRLPWTAITAVRLGPKVITKRRTTQFSMRPPLIVTVNDAKLMDGCWRGFSFRHQGHPMPGGGAEIMVAMDGCPVSEWVLAKHLARLVDGGADLRPVDAARATLGGVKLNQPARSGRAGWLNFAFVGVFCAILAVIFFYSANRGRESLSWPGTSATIRESRFSGSGENRTYHVRYDYTVAGQSYRGTRLAYILSGSNYGEYRRMFPVGSRVTAYYNPDDPSDAVLLSGGSDGAGWGLMFGVGAVLGIAAAAWRRSKARATPPEPRS